MNQIVFTQDVPGERDWLKKIYPDFKFFETYSSVKWPGPPVTDFQKINGLWEVPPEIGTDVSGWKGLFSKSLFDCSGQQPNNHRWLDADQLLVDQTLFKNKNSKSKHCLVLHLPRSGTVFLETILNNVCGYTQLKNWSSYPTVKGTHNHYIPEAKDTVVGKIEYDLIAKYQPDVFFVYRKSWWDIIASTVIIKYLHNTDPENFDGLHYKSNIDLSAVKPTVLLKSDIDDFVKSVHYSFNNLCHMVVTFKNLNFYIIEFDDLIKNQHLTDHKKINYNKHDLISNYHDAKLMFDHQMYEKKLSLFDARFIKHLKTMNCFFPQDLSIL